MPLSWNEIKSRAIAFSQEWKNETSEDAEAKSFWDEFFQIFDIKRRRLAAFEFHVKKLNNKDGYIDLFWPGMLIVEHKSRGKSLDKAHEQVFDYFYGLVDKELPKYILVSDFAHFRLYDLDNSSVVEFPLVELVDHISIFGFIAGYQKRTFKEQDPVNIEAAQLMGKLHDKLKAIGYDGHALELYLVRLLFCLFADDTSIFEKGIFQEYIELKTNEDGSDLAGHIGQLFQVLNTPENKRFKNLDEALIAFPYVNGKLFEETISLAHFDSDMRRILLNSCLLDWGKISPAIFGSLFQSVMDDKTRRNLGAHYTSEKNILKLIKPLFLDELWQEFDIVKGNRNKLIEFHKKLSELKFLDPACGCGNFLVITYRELRLLEIALLRALNKTGKGFLNISEIIWLDVDMMNGIEFEEFPAQIAQVAMWLIDHQMNMLISAEFGQYFVRLPLNKAAKIIHADALLIDWESVVNKTHLSFILGNPPFIGSKIMKQSQRDEIVRLFDNIDGSGTLDYVTGWYVKAANFILNTRIKVAFVSTNSIVQGEQTSILWGQLMRKYKIKIHFAHRTFKWSNEAKGNAAVYCVIVGFANFEVNVKTIYEYEDINGDPHEVRAKNINPYLVDANDILITKKSKPLFNVPEMNFGNMPLDGGHLLLSDKEKDELIMKESGAEKFIKPLISAYEFLNGQTRWCLWLTEAKPNELSHLPEVLKRIELVKKFRMSSKAPSTRKFALTPSLFRDRNQPKTFIVLPRVSSEHRLYIPIGFFDDNYIVSDTCMAIPDARLFHFGVLTSSMHMTWVRYVCGRLESRFRYSKDIVYNNYPWPKTLSDKLIKDIEEKAQGILEARALFPHSSLADLYGPLTMPPILAKAHQALNRVVDLGYRTQPFTNETKRIEFLFELYDKYTSGLFASMKTKRSKK